jgi:hypothetical protein
VARWVVLGAVRKRPRCSRDFVESDSKRVHVRRLQEGGSLQAPRDTTNVSGPRRRETRVRVQRTFS